MLNNISHAYYSCDCREPAEDAPVEDMIAYRLAHLKEEPGTHEDDYEEPASPDLVIYYH